jgi:hypothetical protein
MDGVMYSLLSQYSTISFDYFKVQEQGFNLDLLFTRESKDILILDNVDKLLYYNNPNINHLKKLDNYLFVVCLTHEFCNNQFAFWVQFKNKLSVKLPSLEFYTSLLKYYFGKWATHWKHSKVLLSEEDYTTLAKYCAYCTSKDVAKFTQNVFYKIIYDENATDITLSFLENKDNMLLFTPFDEYTYCIINEDKSKIQKRFDPADNLSELDNITRKRLRPSPLDHSSGGDGGSN